MKVILYYKAIEMLDVYYSINRVGQPKPIEVPDDVLDRHEKAVLELMAVQRILELYKNEG